MAASMTPQFESLIGTVTKWLAGRAIEPKLATELKEAFPPDSEIFKALAEACREGVRDGWLAARGEENLRWGRVIKPSPATQDYSVDVVRMTDIEGPYHGHPKGEIDLVVPLDPDAQFDGQGEGWVVYGPGSAHSPTVRGGAAIVLYLLPGGEIAFSKS
jgi:hypothetical protein